MKSFDKIIQELREEAKPFHEREIAAVITSTSLQSSHLVNFQILPATSQPAFVKFRAMALETGMKKPFLPPWEKFMVLSTLKNPDVFVLLAPYIALSASEKEGKGVWNGKGRAIDKRTIENFQSIRDLSMTAGCSDLPLAHEYFIEISIGSLFGRLRHLLEGVDSPRL
jgi:hypothetical protein